MLQTRYAQALGLMQQALPDHENCPHAASRLREVIVFEDMLGLKLEFAAHGNMLRRYEAAKALASHRYGLVAMVCCGARRLPERSSGP